MLFEKMPAKQIYANLDFVVATKNKDSKYTFINEKGLQLLDIDSPRKIIGKSDANLHWRKYADSFVAGDRSAMNKQPYINMIEPLTLPKQKEIRKCLVTKSPLFNRNDQCIGVILSNIDITNCFIRKKSAAFRQIGENFCLGKYFGNEHLTKREVEVLKGILLGHSMKYIAKFLTISPRTVETHINKIKQKLQCYSKGDIIVTAIKSGLNFAILDSGCWS